jgi:hypothetical protein
MKMGNYKNHYEALNAEAPMMWYFIFYAKEYAERLLDPWEPLGDADISRIKRYSVLCECPEDTQQLLFMHWRWALDLIKTYERMRNISNLSNWAF